MEENAVAVLAEGLSSWRRGPYPKSSSYVSANRLCDSTGEPRWVVDVHNILDLHQTFEVLTNRQVEVLERYVVNGDGMARIGADIGLSERAVGIELEIVLKLVLTQYVHFTSEKNDF